MNLRDLKYLIALANHENFGRAAEKCFISQPTLSIQIKKLEAELGVTLLERSKKSLLFTSIGRQIVNQAKEIVLQIDQMKEIASLAQNPYGGEVKMGIIPSLAPYFLPYVIPAINDTYPELRLFLSEAKTANILQQLQEGTLDAGIVGLPISTSEFSITQLFHEPFMLAVAKKHPLANRKKIDFLELQNERLMLLEDGHCLRDQALAVCDQINIPVDKSFQATSLETLYHMVSTGLGITLMPKLACKPNDSLAYIAFQKPGFSRSIGMIWRKSSIKLKLLNEMGQLIKQRMVKVVKSATVSVTAARL